MSPRKPTRKPGKTTRTATQLQLAAENAVLRAELVEAREQQAATDEILGIISRSPNDAQPVFDAIARHAVALCGGEGGIVLRYDGEQIHLAAHNNLRPGGAERMSRFPRPPDRSLPAGVAILDRVIVHVTDLQASEFTGAPAREAGLGSVIAVPLLREGRAIGALTVTRQETGGFSDRQIALLQSFGAQAVIAIENVRLFRGLETRNTDLSEALEQQTATSEILRVISGSPTDIRPVLDTIAASAVRVCEGYDAMVYLREGDIIRRVAHQGPVRMASTDVVPLDRTRHVWAVILGRQTIHVADAQADAEFPETQRLARAVGLRTQLAVPLLREREAIGAVVMRRHEMKPFTDKQIALLETFADQAVIAIENVRLFTELQEKNRELTRANAQVTEALEQQTATSEILRVISSSPTDVHPVFAAVAASAARLCDAYDAAIFRVDGDALRLVAHEGPIPTHPIGQGPPLVRGTPPGRAVLERRTIHLLDAQAETDEYPEGSAIARRLGHRTTLVAPLLRVDEAIGVIALRRAEARPFTDRQVELLQTFAAQAVIAIENVRLFDELQARNRDLTEAHAQVTEALERQTATAEILRVISSSPTDVQPIFDAIVRSASRLCGGEYAIVTRYDGELLHLAAQYNPRPGTADETARFFPQIPRRETSIVASALVKSAVVHVSDIETEDLEPAAREAHRRIRLRAVVAVPMMHEGRPIGVISVSRGTPGPFAERQIDLLRTFADQAVIAIQNVRLFKELEARNRDLTEALEQQTATAEILRVISRSPTDVQPVFDTIVGSAGRLCVAESAAVYRFEDGMAHFVGQYNFSPETIEIYGRDFPRPLQETDHLWRIADGSVLNIADIAADPHTSARVADAYRSRGARSLVLAPMVRDAKVIGAIGVTHRDVGAFSDERLQLLKTFADQAVIAIENVRLFKELEARNRDLTESLDRQTATAEILRVISQAQTDVQPVFEAIADSAMRLFGAWSAAVFRYDGELTSLAAARGGLPGSTESFMARLRVPWRPTEDMPPGRAVLTRTVQHVADVVADPSWGPQLYQDASERGFRSVVAVPMLRGGDALGVIAITRARAGGFTPTEIGLLQTFADQAVIAVENVRLFKELEARNLDLSEALEQQTATAEILRVISSSPTAIGPVLDAIATCAMRVCSSYDALVFLREGDLMRRAAHQGPVGLVTESDLIPITRARMGGTAILERRIVHVADAQADHDFPGTRELARTLGTRTTLAVPLLREEEAVGAIVMRRHE